MRRATWLLMIALAVLVCSQAQAEDVEPEFEVTTVTVEVRWFGSVMSLRRWLDNHGCEDCDTTNGISLCKQGETCYVYAVRPREVDDKWTTVFGHEVMHGLFGRYHEEWYYEAASE